MTPPRRIVIVGNGIAGLTAADGLRANGFDGELTIVGDEGRSAYSRPALSKALLRSDADLTSHELPPPDHGATELRGVAARELDADQHRIHLDDGTELPFDGLVIASGSRARRLGSGSDELVLRTLDDALALRHSLAEQPELVIVGGGPLGMEVASGALEAGCRVTLVSTEPPLRRHLGDYLSAAITTEARRHGLTLIVASAPRIIELEGRSAVALDDGRVIGADLVLTAIGDLPNTEWLAGSGISSSGALLVDSRMRVRPGIVAAGDVVAAPTANGHERTPLWNAAIDQARVAAASLLRDDSAPYHPQPYFWTEQFGLNIRVAGRPELIGEPEVVEQDDSTEARLLRWRHADGTASAVAVNYRIPIPRLRRLCAPEAERATEV